MATIQSAIISAVSNVIAQTITAFGENVGVPYRIG